MSAQGGQVLAGAATMEAQLDVSLDAVQQARREGLPARDPVAWAVIEALARRAAAQQGAVREALLQRLQGRLAALHASAPIGTQASPAAAATAPEADPMAALRDLVDRLGRMPVPAVAARAANKASAVAVAQPLKSVTAFKGTWSRLRADQRLRQAMAQVPSMAGPLNSSHLVNRMLQTLRDLSPEYLDAFMAHADTLLWLEQTSGATLPVRPQRR